MTRSNDYEFVLYFDERPCEFYVVVIRIKYNQSSSFSIPDGITKLSSVFPRNNYRVNKNGKRPTQKNEAKKKKKNKQTSFVRRAI